MKYIFIPEKDIFSDAIDEQKEHNQDSAKFLDFLAEQRAIKKYKIAVIPASLVNIFKTGGFFQKNRTAELVMEYVEEEPSVSSANVEEDYFEVARVKATDKIPIIVSNKKDKELAAFRGSHATTIFSPKRALELSKVESFEL